ncbi:MAG: Trp biosynthesis-associated membrane protein [Mycobacteriales bacterium]
MTPRREYGAALLLCAFGAALLLLAASRDWVRLEPFGGGTMTADSVYGDVARALGLAALAGVVGVAATVRRGRRAVGVVLVLVGILAIIVAADGVSNPAASGVSVGGAPDNTATGWPWVAVVGGALVACSGFLVAVRGSRWAAMSSRYDGPQNSRQKTEVAGDAGLWDAQSRGEDLT